MKKGLLVLFLSLVILIPCVSVKAGYLDSYVDWVLDRSVFAHQLRAGEDHITNLAMITANGKIAYCIEPGVVADKASNYSSTININETSLINVDTKRLSLIGYYGYGYPGHDEKEYYMAAQELIWRQMGVENVWWTDSKVGGNVLNIEYYKNEILRLVNQYEISPEFNFKSKYIVGDDVQLSDSNTVLSGYELKNVYDNVKIKGNTLNIKVKDGNNSFVLRRKGSDKTTMFYYKAGYQTIGSFEFPYCYEKEYKIDYTYGRIIVDKLDAITGSKETSSKYASLKDAVYALYDINGKIIKQAKTDENGRLVFDNLPKGNYSVKELSPSMGYLLDKSINKTFVGTNMIEVTLKSYEEPIKNKIIITKVLDDEQNQMCIPEEGILFFVYDEEGNYVTQDVTDENGNITLELYYGKYILRQESTMEGVDKVKDKIIEVTRDGRVQSIALVNHKIIIPSTPGKIIPKTGKNTLFNFIFLLPFSLLGYSYEKKHI